MPRGNSGYPTLRLAGSAQAVGNGDNVPDAGPKGSPGGAAYRAGASGAALPDERWCGIEPLRPAADGPPPCKYVGLPCGPVSAAEISHGGGEVGEDLDGDGQSDLTLSGYRDLPKPEVYGAIYRGTAAGFVLADYQVAPLHSEATAATVILAAPGSPPLLRDGYDIVEAGGRTLSIARLRRFDGQRFRTLLSFCAHRAEPTQSTPPGVREGNNRIEIVDIDKDGQKDLVVHGLIRPVVFRFSDSGLALVEDPALGQLYRDNSPETQRVKALRVEAGRQIESGQLRRASETLSRAQAVTPYDIALTLELCGLLIRTDQADKAVDLLGRARFQAPERAAIYCALARAQRALRDANAERSSLITCLAKQPDDALRSEAEARLRELATTGPATPPPAPPSSDDPS